MLRKDDSYHMQYPEIVLVKASPLFDRNWYLAKYSQAAASGLEPEQHYLQIGAKQGYDPGPHFSTHDYLYLYPDVGQVNPLVHYEMYGRAEGRSCRIEKNSYQPHPQKKIKLFFISGEPETPGHTYRISRYAQAAKNINAEINEFTVHSAFENREKIREANLLFIWRAQWDEQLATLFFMARKANIPIVFDIDDLLIDPQLAKINIVDGIRTTNSNEKAAENFFESLQKSLENADYCSAPTHFLSNYLSALGKKTFQLPNGFDEKTWQASRLARRIRLKSNDDGLIRIGYAGGSRTHQKDFAKVVPALARILRKYPQCRLVLFRKAELVCTDVEEFPLLSGLSSQIEWREHVPLNELPQEMARFDVNLAPLEVGNPFCEAKSELKFFESALVEVPVVASPTLTFREAIEDGKTGFLATDEGSWYHTLSQLLDNPVLRKEIGRNAYYSVLWKYGCERRMELFAFMLEMIFHRGLFAARAFELNLLTSKFSFDDTPKIPPHEILFHHDQFKTAEVTVVVPCYNDSYCLLNRLQSIHEQTLLNIDLIIVDDCSTDHSVEIAMGWLHQNRDRFNRILLIKNQMQSGIGLTRNVGFSHAETLFVIGLNSEQCLLPDFATQCLTRIKENHAAFAYSNYYAENGSQCKTDIYDPLLFRHDNFIGGPALIKLAAWMKVGGYAQLDDSAYEYDFWCKCVEHGLFGEHVNETLWMNTFGANDFAANQSEIRECIYTRHAWIWKKILRNQLNVNEANRE